MQQFEVYIDLIDKKTGLRTQTKTVVSTGQGWSGARQIVESQYPGMRVVVTNIRNLDR